MLFICCVEGKQNEVMLEEMRLSLMRLLKFGSKC
jgi:hypothetical protein